MTVEPNVKVKVFIVRAENGGCPESYIMGVYPTEALAQARIDAIESNYIEEFCFEYVWFQTVNVGAEGADCELCNR